MIALRRDFEFAEFQGGLIAFAWGVWLIATRPFAAAADVYRVLAAQMPEQVWGLIFISLGVCQLWGLLYHRWSIRRWASMLAFAWWFYAFLSLAMGSPTVLSVPTTLAFAIGAAWGHLRIMLERPR